MTAPPIIWSYGGHGLGGLACPCLRYKRPVNIRVRTYLLNALSRGQFSRDPMQEKMEARGLCHRGASSSPTIREEMKARQLPTRLGSDTDGYRSVVHGVECPSPKAQYSKELMDWAAMVSHLQDRWQASLHAYGRGPDPRRNKISS